MNLRRGLLVVISDFFDPAGLDAVRDALRGIRHRLLFVQLVRPIGCRARSRRRRAAARLRDGRRR